MRVIRVEYSRESEYRAGMIESISYFELMEPFPSEKFPSTCEGVYYWADGTDGIVYFTPNMLDHYERTFSFSYNRQLVYNFKLLTSQGVPDTHLHAVATL